MQHRDHRLADRDALGNRCDCLVTLHHELVVPMGGLPHSGMQRSAIEHCL